MGLNQIKIDRAERRKRQQEAIERSRLLQKQLQEERKRAEEEATRNQGEIMSKRNAVVSTSNRSIIHCAVSSPLFT